MARQAAQNELAALQSQRAELNQFNPDTVGAVVRKASLPAATTSKMALGKAVGVFGLFVLAGLAIAWFLDRRDGLGGGRRRIEQIVPGANIRVMPGAEGSSATPAEIDTAIDRLAVELVAGGTARCRGVGARHRRRHGAARGPGRGAGLEPRLRRHPRPVRAGRLHRPRAAPRPHGRVVRRPRDLERQRRRPGRRCPPRPASPPSRPTPTVTWLRPKGSAEAVRPAAPGRGRLARLPGRAASGSRRSCSSPPSPSRTAAGTALGQWVGRTALIVAPDERSQAESVATALAEADVRVTEVVWT